MKEDSTSESALVAKQLVRQSMVKFLCRYGTTCTCTINSGKAQIFMALLFIRCVVQSDKIDTEVES